MRTYVANSNFNMKKVICIIISVLCIFGTVPMFNFTKVYGSTETGELEFKQLLVQMLTTGDTTTHDISNYHLTYPEMADIWYNLVVDSNEVAVATSIYTNLNYAYTVSNGYVVTFRLKNVESGFTAKYEQMKAEVTKALEGINSNMSDLEKVLYIHDYLIYTTEFDYNRLLAGTVPDTSYTAYGVIVTKKAVCDGYTKAFNMYMDLLGIDSQYIVSSVMDHSWSVVRIDKNYYFVDLAWDDPVTDMKGRVSHTYFVRSTEEFKSMEHAHYGWTQWTNCSSTLYKNWFVHDINGKMIYHNGCWYYADANGSLVKSAISGADKNVIVQGGSTLGTAIYAVDQYNGSLIYGQGNKLILCSMDGNNKKVVMTVQNIPGELNDIKYLHISETGKLTYTYLTYTNDYTYLRYTTDTCDLTQMVNASTSTEDTSCPAGNSSECNGSNTSNNNDESSSSGVNQPNVDDNLTVIVTQQPASTEQPVPSEQPVTSINSKYTKVEYVEFSTNGNGIDTEYCVNGNTSVAMDLALTTNNTYGYLLNGINGACSQLFFKQGGNGEIYAAYGWSKGVIGYLGIGERTVISQENNKTFFKGVLVRTSKQQTFQTSNTLILANSKCRLYGCKIWDNGVLIREYIPVINGNGTACLYDVVNDKLYYAKNVLNAGDVCGEVTQPTVEPTVEPTIQPTVEPVVEPTTQPTVEPTAEPTTLSEYTKVEYVEFTTNGNGINTGYCVNGNSSVSFDYALTTTNTYGYIVNGINDSCNQMFFKQGAGGDIYTAYGWSKGSIGNVNIGTKSNVSQMKNITYLNGTIVRTSKLQTYQTTNALQLANSMCKVYGCKIWDFDLLVRDFIPVIDKNGTACLYDLISKEFYYAKNSLVAGEKCE